MNTISFLAFSTIMIGFWLYGVWKFADYLTDMLVPTKYRYQYDEAAELNFGDIIGIGDDLNGATLCGNCQRHFKSNGSLEVCNEC